MKKISIVVPMYYEEEVAEECYKRIIKVFKEIKNYEYEIVFVNDGSKDKTYEIMREYVKTRPYLCPLTKRNSGHGGTVLYGYHYALKHSADYIFQTDSDG